jgi:aryl-alcohol dehydrogenase-like predicted oxidoreductase
MDMRKLGRTGLKVAPICFGGNVLGWTTDEHRSFDVLDAYVEGGGNFIDTADSYSRWVPGHEGGESETVLGNWMQARSNRAQIVVATKLGNPMGSGPNDRGTSRGRIFRSIEGSLRRLQTDYIDLYQAHIDDRDTPLDETLRALDDLIRQGKVRYIGASNYTAWRLATALGVSEKHGYARYETLQPRYNLAAREDYERELEPLCQEQGIGVITYSSLASGFFSGKYRAGQALPGTPRAQGVQRGYMNEKGFAILDAVEQIAREHGATPGQVALAWILARPAITAPIASATSVEQTRELLGAADLRLNADALAILDAASAWRPAPA